jgi:hypothetical protein
MCIKINKIGKQEVGIWSYMHIFRHIFLSNYWCQKSDIWSQASYRYPITWEAFLDPSDSYFSGKQEVGIWWVQKRFPRYGVPIWSLWPNIRFMPSIVAEKNVTKNILDGRRTDRGKTVYPPPPSGSGVYIHLYMHIFCHIFLSNYWWHKSDIWSQAPYRYPISWEAFLDPSDSYFLFAAFVDFYTHWTYMLKNHYPQYGIPIWCLWPNIRFLPSTVTEKNVMKNILDGRKDRGKTVYSSPPSGNFSQPLLMTEIWYLVTSFI